jgi:tetratricopeptide (TPR) repeat protein
LISSTDKFRLLDNLYHQRDLQRKTLENALSLVTQLYKEYQSTLFSLLPAAELRAISIICEALDYFNRFDAFIGYGIYEENEIYSWLTECSKELYASIPFNLPGPVSVEESRLLLNRIRLVTTITLNEQYRKHDYSCGPESDLAKVITIAEQHIQPKLKENIEAFNDYQDVMVNLHFLHGKAARQMGEYIEAERSFYKSSSYLLDLILSLSASQESKITQQERLLQILSKIRRIGVADLARAWLYLVWGKIDKANLYVERAIQLLGPDDQLSHMLAQSIRGTVLRIQSRHDSEILKESINLLKQSYKSFLSGDIKVPRHSIRTLYELEIALILSNNLEEAITTLEEVINKVNHTGSHSDITEELYRRDFKKLVKDSRWQSQVYILLSRIARKDIENRFEERLYFLSKRLESTYKLKEQQSLSPRPRSFRSGTFAIDCAKSARRIARDNGLRTCEVDSLVTLGEAYFNLKDFDDARKIFKQCLELVNIPYGQSLGQGIDGSNFAAISHLCLARIAVSKQEEAEAEKEFQAYKQLPLVQHSWILFLAETTESEIQEMAEKKIIVSLSESITWENVKESLHQEAVRKLIIEPLKNGVRKKEIMHRLEIKTRTTLSKLIRKYGNNGLLLPNELLDEEDD